MPSPASDTPDPEHESTDSASADALPDDGRDETENERLDRNWSEILQELRVLQTGTQILTGFLLTLAFQQRFTDLTPLQVQMYLLLVVLAVLATILGLAPVSLHRILFRRGAKSSLVHIVNVMMRITLGAVALVIAGTASLIFEVVLGYPWGFLAGGIALLLTIALWLGLPAWTRSTIRKS